VREMKRSILIFIILALIISLFISEIVSSEKPERDVIVGFYKTPGPSENALIHSNGGAVKHNFNLIHAVSARLPEQAIENLKKNPRIAYIEDDVIMMAMTDEYANSWGVSHIGSQIVHNNGIDGTGVKIAVLDTGIDYTHEDLDDNYKGGVDFVQYLDPTITPDPMDNSGTGHGTHVAGIIAAENNGVGVVGVAPNASLYSIKVLDGSGHGLASWIIAGIEWAVENEMDIVTMSLGGLNSISLQEACDNAFDKGLLLVASAGNTDSGNVEYPAAYDSVIAVTATDQDDQKAYFSPISAKVELAAPGVDIFSTIGHLSSSGVSGNEYDYLSGTSQAAPHVAGTAALIISNGIPDVNNDGTADNIDIRLQLQKTAIDLGDYSKDDVYGYGLVDAQAAVFESPEIPVPLIELTLIRTNESPAEDAIHQALSSGSYEITIKNNNMSKVKVEVYQNEAIQKDLSSKYIFTKSVQEVIFDLEISDTMEIVFIPQGKKMTSADIIINERQGWNE
jgi:subtilisin